MAASSLATPEVQDKIRGALFGLCVTDAVAMPVHWYYNLERLVRDYGTITEYVKPQDRFEASLMNKSSTGGAGYGPFEGDIIGTTICHGKKHLWEPGQENHYHIGMEAGQNTLEVLLTRLMLRQITKDKQFIADNYRESYMTFMQTPDSHNDTYAATGHRTFFQNLVNGKDPKECPQSDPNCDTADALTISIPVILQNLTVDKEVRDAKVLQAIHIIRNIEKAEKHAILFSDLLVSVIVRGVDLREAIVDAATKMGIEDFVQSVETSTSDPMAACAIDKSFGAFLFITYKYADSLERTVLANANAGGENISRGALVGTLIGAAYGMQGFTEWMVNGLHEKDEINPEIDAFLAGLTSAE